MSDLAFEVWFISVYGKNRDKWFKDDMRMAFNAGVLHMQKEMESAEEHINNMTQKLENIGVETK